MADTLQGQPGSPSQPTAAETTPLPVSPETVVDATGAADATANPNPAPAEPVDWDKVGGEAYADLKKQAFAEPAPGQPATDPVTEPVTTDPPTDAAPAVPAEPVPPVEPVEEPTPFGDKFRPRLGKLPKVAQEAIQLVREMTEAGTPIELGEAEKRVKAKYGIADAPAAANEPAAPAQHREPEEIERQIGEMEDALVKAGESADTLEIVRLQKEMRAADKALSASRAAQQQAAARETADIAAAKKEVRGSYPMFADKDSALSKHFNAVYDRLEAQRSPILNASPADQMRTVSLIAAAELGIKPVDPNAPVAPVAPAATTQASPPTLTTNPPARPVQPASGALRTATPTNAAAQVSQRIESVKSMDDYEKLKAELLPATR